MAEQKFVKYGDRTMALEAGMTLEQVKELMVRHFPELADPKIDTKKAGDKTTYVFSKKSGHKGNGLMNAVIDQIEQHCIAEPIADPATLRAVEKMNIEFAAGASRDAVRELREEAEAVRATANALLDAPADRPLTGAVL